MNAELVLKEGYTQIDGQYYELYSLSPYKVLPYIVNVNMTGAGYDWDNYVNIDGSKRDEVADGAWVGNHATDDAWDDANGTYTADESDRELVGTADKAIVPYYVNANGTKKFMLLESGAKDDDNWLDQAGYINILGEYTTTNPLTFDANNGELSDYWVNVDGKYYVVVSEMTTYLDKEGEWNYKRDQWGNPIYIHVGGKALNNAEVDIPGPGASDINGFIELNTDKDEHLQVVRSPYLREVQKDELDAYQYSMKFVSNVNNASEAFATAEEKELAEWQQDAHLLFTQSGYEVFDSVSASSISEGSWGSLQNFYAQEWTRFDSQDEALLAWYNVHYVFGNQDELLDYVAMDYLGLPWDYTKKQVVDGLIADGSAQAMRFFKYLHVDEYYEELKPDEGYILCAADADGFAVKLSDGYDAGEIGAKYERINGSRANITEDEIRIRAFQWIPTSEYKQATSQNLLQFHKNEATGKYYVDTEYEGAVWFNDGNTDYMAYADGIRPFGDPRFADFQKLGFYVNWAHRDAAAEKAAFGDPAGDIDYITDEDGLGWGNRLANADAKLNNGAANQKWLDETGLVIDQDRLDRLKGTAPNTHGYIYVHVTIYDYNEATHTFIVDPALGAAGQDRWYKTVNINAERDSDALYDANSGEWYYKKPVRESVATELIPGGYYEGGEGISEKEVTALADAFDLADIDYPIFKVVQARENGRFYAVRDYDVVAPRN